MLAKWSTRSRCAQLHADDLTRFEKPELSSIVICLLLCNETLSNVVQSRHCRVWWPERTARADGESGQLLHKSDSTLHQRQTVF